MKFINTLILILIFSSCGERIERKIILELDSSAVKSTAYGTPIVGRWDKNSFPLKLNIAQSFSHSQMEQISDTADKWNRSSSFNLIEVNPTSSVSKSTATLNEYKTDGVMGVYLRGAWFEEYKTTETKKSPLAITYYSGNVVDQNGQTWFKITHADLFLNDQDYNFYNALETEGNAGEYEFRSVVLHELGHFIGLADDNSNSRAQVMYPTLSAKTIRTELTKHDEFAIHDLYNQLSSSEIAEYNSKNSGTTTASLNEMELTQDYKAGTVIHGVVQLMPDGQCEHYLGDKMVHSHQLKLK